MTDDERLDALEQMAQELESRAASLVNDAARLRKVLEAAKIIAH